MDAGERWRLEMILKMHTDADDDKHLGATSATSAYIFYIYTLSTRQSARKDFVLI